MYTPFVFFFHKQLASVCKHVLTFSSSSSSFSSSPSSFSRLRILQNICTAHVRLGEYNEAVSTYEFIMNEMKEKADFKTG